MHSWTEGAKLAAMDTVRSERRLAAILAADIVGYSRLIELDESGTLAAIKSLRTEVIDPLVAEYRGRIVKVMGDGAIIEFASVVDAVACAVATQKAVSVRQSAISAERRIVFRIGVNLGDVVVENGDLLGDGVNLAARLEQLCDPGGVLVSGTAYDHLQGRLGLPLDFAGEQRVKNISRPVPTYRVRLEGGKLRMAVDRRRLQRLLSVVAALIFVLVLLAGAAWWFMSESPARDKPSIAVVPFDNLGGDEATGRLADGLTEDIITDLARVASLR
jgi:class 3 adenylate cyclase